MTDKNEIKLRIIEIAGEKIKKFGIKKVTTDEIAREVGISKRTLYELFATKLVLVKEIVTHYNNYLAEIFIEIKENQSKNPFQKINEMTKAIRTKKTYFNFQAIMHLQKSYPAIAQMDTDNRNKLMDIAFEIFNEGAKQGIFRKDVKADIFFTLFENILNQFIMEGVSRVMPYTFEEMMENLTKVILQGILTKEAIMNGYLDYLEA